MKEGTKPLLFHVIHTSAVVLMMAIALVLGDCLGDVDDGEKYTFFFRHGNFTLLHLLYAWSMLIFFLVVSYLCSFFSVPYGVMYWIKNRRNPGTTNDRKGIILTAITLLLIIAHPFGTVYFAAWIDRYIEFWPTFFLSVICVIIVINTYIIPYYFIRLSYPGLTDLRIFKAYRIFIIAQIIICLFSMAFSAGAFPELREALKTFIDSRYSRWYNG